MYRFILCILLFFIYGCNVELTGFIDIKNGKLVENGAQYKLHGTNQYYLFYKPHQMIDNVIDSSSSLNLNVIRTWAFCEGALHDGFCFQPSMRSYDEPTFQNLDYVIYKAKQKGIKLILTLSNNWGDFGGVDQYNRWVNSYNHDDFFRNENIKSIFRDYVRYIINRKNIYTGVVYKDDPTIAMWELMNEPRCGDSVALYSWIDEMAGYIKSLDSNHLVSTGSEGSIASDFMETHKSKNIDVASFHLYPDWWGFSPERSLEYIKEHAAMANTLGKPAILGEFGLKDQQKRNEIFSQWYSTGYSSGLTGMLFWLLSGRQTDGSLYPDYDGFTVWCPESGQICNTIKNYSHPSAK